MKKRIISLLLVLAMVMSAALVLVSCKDDPPDDTPPATIPTETIKYLPSNKAEGEDAYSAVTSSVVFGEEFYNQNSWYFSIISSYVKLYVDYGNESADYEGATTDSYVLFSDCTGQSFNFTVVNVGGYEGTLPNDTVIGYDIETDYAGNGYYYWGGVSLKLFLADGTFTYYLFDAFLNQIDEIDTDDAWIDFYVSYDYDYDNHTYLASISWAENEYESRSFVDPYNGEAYYVKKITQGNGEEDFAPIFMTEMEYDEDSEEYYYVNGATVSRFDKEGKLIFSYTLEYAKDARLQAAFLPNGNVFYQCLLELNEDAQDYDAFVEGSKYNIDTFIYSPADGKLTELEGFKYYDKLITAQDEQIKSLNITEGTCFMVEPLVITGEGGVQTLIDTVVAFNDSLEAIKYYKEPVINYSLEVLQNGAIIYSDDFTSYIVDENGNKLADLPSSDSRVVNDNWFIDGGCVYNARYELIYDFEADGRELITVGDDYLILEGEATVDETTDTYLFRWKGVGNETRLFKESSVFVNINDYFITETFHEDSSRTVELFAPDGTLMKKWDGVWNFNWYTVRGHDGYTGVYVMVITETDIYDGETLVDTESITEYYFIYQRPNVILK